MTTLKTIAASVVVGAACVHGFAPAAMPSLSLRSARTCSPLTGLKMQDSEEYKPLIPTKENPMAPDYAREPTQFERQGLVDSGKNEISPIASLDGGFGGLTRRETIGTAGAAGAGLVGVLWAVTRNPGYDTKDTSRDAGVAAVDGEALATPELQAGLKDLQATKAKLVGLYEAFNEDNNIALSESLQSFSIVKLRNDLNLLTTALDEDTQIKTDRIVRVIIQDLVELDQAVKVKKDMGRTPKKVAATRKWFSQTIGDFDKFIAYFVAK
uniref:Uncharacterized protein n=1 Tax=Hemiselmis andersenii TaxID=464988 RepID=A0A6U4RY14_HEMAN|mmetsp:Transcript_15395/g.35456  ORF Transcript_15395/g.35456 Transcript_15395/m.35456 type:complete len:268 (-) Transcript_15395:97-900(-)|eukprot:CAMPEP_0114128662 /NCGR_PEP_ID=MMETSP0043_2-20121206/11053_1 /TAXON_ID=464988 /ORGANISM="Hemiselmis andersenii, Strain CCMP644" /LENGTH=267 /DNA_ID=CAMNT_0001221869 /DNA_START=43 /DNA_END=846 /DNA_ORIENTATION=-